MKEKTFSELIDKILPIIPNEARVELLKTIAPNGHCLRFKHSHKPLLTNLGCQVFASKEDAFEELENITFSEELEIVTVEQLMKEINTPAVNEEMQCALELAKADAKAMSDLADSRNEQIKELRAELEKALNTLARIRKAIN